MMFEVLKKQKGSSLIIVLIVMTVLMILGIAITTISFAETRFTSSHEDRIQAYYIARTGAHAVSEFIVNDSEGDADRLIDAALNVSSDENFQIGGGEFVVSIDEIDNALIVTSIGEYNGVSQTVKTKIVQSGVFWGDYAIAGKTISTSSNGNKTTVIGDIAAKDSLNLGDKMDVDGEAGVVSELEFPEIIPPESYDTTYGNITSDITIGLNDYDDKYVYAKDIFVGNNHLNITVEGEGNVHLYVEGDIDMHNNCQFIVPDEAKLFIYVIGVRNITLHQGSSTTQNNVLVYAPDSAIGFESAGPSYFFFGAIVGDTVTIHNQLEIKHNPEMASLAKIENPATKSYTWVD